LAGGDADRLRGEADRFLGGGLFFEGGIGLRAAGEPPLFTDVAFLSVFFSGSPLLSSRDFSPPFFFLFFLSRDLDLDRLESELLELESLLLSEELLDELCFLFLF